MPLYEIGSDIEHMGKWWKLVAKRDHVNRNNHLVEILYWQNGNQLRSCSHRSIDKMSRVGFKEIIKYQNLFVHLVGTTTP